MLSIYFKLSLFSHFIANISEKPIIEFSGVLNSWEILARNSSLSRLLIALSS